MGELDNASSWMPLGEWMVLIYGQQHVWNWGGGLDRIHWINTNRVWKINLPTSLDYQIVIGTGYKIIVSCVKSDHRYPIPNIVYSFFSSLILRSWDCNGVVALRAPPIRVTKDRIKPGWINMCSFAVEQAEYFCEYFDPHHVSRVYNLFYWKSKWESTTRMWENRNFCV